MKKNFLAFFVLLFVCSVSAETVNLSSGEVASESIFSSDSSSNWAGVVGKSETINSPLNSEKVADVVFTGSELGTVTSKNVRGIDYGGYYYLAVPGAESLNSGKLESLENLSELDAGKLFDESSFPGFYPNYETRIDAPNQTFKSKANITLFNRSFEAGAANLSKQVPFYVLKYNDSGEEKPAFVTPIKGSEPGESFGECYDGSSCDYEMILPKTSGNTSSYGLFMAGTGKTIQECRRLNSTGTSYLLSSNYLANNSACFDFNVSKTLAFAGESLQVEETCGLRINRSNNPTVVNADIEGVGRGICASGAESKFVGGSVQTSSWSFDLQNSDLYVENLLTDATGFYANRSVVELDKVQVTASSEVSGNYSNVSVESTSMPPAADNITAFSILNLNLKVENLTRQAYVDRLGFYYPPVKQSKIAPTSIVKADSGGVEQLEAVRAQPAPDRRFIYYPARISSFSIFGVIGENITTIKEEIVEEEVEVPVEPNDEESEEVEVDDEAPTPVAPQLRLEPIKVNLSAPDFVDARRTQSKSIEYTLKNTGQEVDGELVVDAQFGSDWETVSSSVDGLASDETKTGELLVRPLESAEIGNSTGAFVVRTSDGQSVDYETARIRVNPLKEVRKVNTVEAPRFLNIGSNRSLKASLLIENTGDYDLESVTVEAVGMERCVDLNAGNVSIERDETRELPVELESGTVDAECQGAFKVKSSGTVVGFSPASISIESSEDREGTPLVIPSILVFWSVIAVREVWKDVG